MADGNGGSTTRELAADEYELLGFDSSKASDKVTVTVQSVADSTKTATFTVKVVADETPTPDPDLATEEELKQLEDAIAKAEAEKLNQDDYTADSWKAYANALAQAKKVLAKEKRHLHRGPGCDSSPDRGPQGPREGLALMARSRVPSSPTLVSPSSAWLVPWWSSPPPVLP